MRGLWHRVAPFATDSSGACAVFQHSDALVVAQDSNGTVSTLRRVIDVNRARATFETADLPELAYTLGHEREFQDRMLWLLEESACDKRHAPELVVLLNGPVAALLGVDLDARAHELAETAGVEVLAVETTGNRFYDKGIAAAYEAICEHFSLPSANKGRPQPGTVGVLGLTELDVPGREMTSLIAEGVAREGKRISCDWGYSDSPDRWRDAVRVAENLVASVSGLRLARRMHDELGTPFTTIDEKGWFDALADDLELAGASHVLVVGEQLGSNLVRRLLGLMGAGDVTVATFYTLDRKCAREGDLRLKGERELVELAQSGGYDLVIADAQLAKCVGPLELFPLMHPPTGFGWRDGTELSRAWLERLASLRLAGREKRTGRARGIPRRDDGNQDISGRFSL